MRDDEKKNVVAVHDTGPTSFVFSEVKIYLSSTRSLC